MSRPSAEAGITYAIYRRPDDEYFATDGLCSHEKNHLADGHVTGEIIERPKHNGGLDYRTGEPKGGPVSANLSAYSVLSRMAAFLSKSSEDTQMTRQGIVIVGAGRAE